MVRGLQASTSGGVSGTQVSYTHHTRIQAGEGAQLKVAASRLTWKALNRLTSMTRPNLLNSWRTSSSLAERSTLAKNSCAHRRGHHRSGAA